MRRDRRVSKGTRELKTSRPIDISPPLDEPPPWGEREDGERALMASTRPAAVLCGPLLLSLPSVCGLQTNEQPRTQPREAQRFRGFRPCSLAFGVL
jgi:hypothetical protein